MIRHWRLDDGSRTLLLIAEGDGLPECVHWGATLPDTDAETLHHAHRRDVTGGMLDANPPLSLCPEASRSFPGQPGLVIPGLAPRFAFAGEDASDGLSLRYADGALGLVLTFRFMLADGILIAWSVLEAETPVRPYWLAAPVLPAPLHSDALIEVAGRWIGEFQLNRTPWMPGARLRESRAGRSDHVHFPGLYLTAPGTTNTGGEAWAFHYAWSGGHRMIAEELPDGRRQIQWGHTAGSEPEGTRFETAPVMAIYSSAGLNGCAIAFQRHVRDRIARPAMPRPVHYNCWEAVYFDHDLRILQDIASRAADLGAERFVLDDGWFGRRDDDNSSLGDWQVDRRKWPDGLTPLIDHVRSLGMTFGLWFEPEMVNRDSDLARAHPDWLLGPDDQIEGRGQHVLDMANPDVRDYLFDAIDAVLSADAIDYVKWDHNRVLPAPDARQARGTYALLDRLRAAHPHVEFETCASGGGRVDFGILARTQRLWLSDSNDALERVRIQHDAALFLPAAITGSHVGPRLCHTSGRILPMSLRAWAAAQRQMGFEMDPRELTDDEAAKLREVTAWWKANRDWTMLADIHRLDTEAAITAEQQIAPEGDRFVVFAALTAATAQIVPRPLRLTALDRNATYRVTRRDNDDLPALSRGAPALKTGSIDVSGTWLLDIGLQLPWTFPQRLHVMEGRRL
ncbi:Alpha-galactosidase [Jannaschia seosinensis]|uniref:alpha-galactosidase n=1 Tax=Jannaschia seosinensis TaxID=313367 RepID=A0A0M7B904_9RHOB|nr:alpha-galactosidase [Jannaschia seosinensis]CUH39267.1 Alpha-galactosidase [Jannaschia seosinensis]